MKRLTLLLMLSCTALIGCADEEPVETQDTAAPDTTDTTQDADEPDADEPDADEPDADEPDADEPDAEADAEADTAADAEPDGTEDTAADAEPDGTEDTPDAVEPDATEDTTPDVVEDTTPDAESDVVEDTTPDAEPDVVEDAPDAEPDTLPRSCDDLIAQIEGELVRVRSCGANNECGQVMLGTSCGCTRNLVARLDADLAWLEALSGEILAQGCDYGFISTCDCPPADGYLCNAGTCEWNYL